MQQGVSDVLIDAVHGTKLRLLSLMAKERGRKKWGAPYLGLPTFLYRNEYVFRLSQFLTSYVVLHAVLHDEDLTVLEELAVSLRSSSVDVSDCIRSLRTVSTEIDELEVVEDSPV